MRKLALLSASMSAAFASVAASQTRRIFGAENIKRHLQGQVRDYAKGAGGSIAKGNRHGGAHEHKREIARRLRQQARASA